MTEMNVITVKGPPGKSSSSPSPSFIQFSLANDVWSLIKQWLIYFYIVNRADWSTGIIATNRNNNNENRKHTRNTRNANVGFRSNSQSYQQCRKWMSVISLSTQLNFIGCKRMWMFFLHWIDAKMNISLIGLIDAHRQRNLIMLSVSSTAYHSYCCHYIPFLSVSPDFRSFLVQLRLAVQ